MIDSDNVKLLNEGTELIVKKLTPTWQQVSATKKTEQWHKIPIEWRLSVELLQSQDDFSAICKESGILSSLEFEITEISSVLELSTSLRTRRYTAEAVIIAYCKRAAIAHQITNCLTEIFFLEAIELAKGLDRLEAPFGAFHGIPVSLKDQFNVIGQESTIGYISRVGNSTAARNSTLVDTILEQGGVVYCKTNVPQTVLSADTVNNIFGRTLNPVVRAIIPGGSSGGEAALLACKGSILGVGTDTGGSIRNPCAACELYGLKPSSGRVSYRRVANSNDGNISVISVAGPMARTLDSLEFFMAKTLETEPWITDHEVLPIPWRSVQLSPETLTIGIMLEHGDPFPPHPCFSRLFDELAGRLRSIGVRVVRFESDELTALNLEIAATLARLVVSDGGREIARVIGTTPAEPLILAGLVDRGNARDLNEVWALNVRARALRNRYGDVWRAMAVDAVLAPTNPFAFLTAEGYATKPAEVGITGLFNLLDYAVVNLPLGPVLAEELTAEQQALGLAGFRVGAQVICGRLEEEKCLAVAGIVDRLLLD